MQTGILPPQVLQHVPHGLSLERDELVTVTIRTQNAGDVKRGRHRHSTENPWPPVDPRPAFVDARHSPPKQSRSVANRQRRCRLPKAVRETNACFLICRFFDLWHTHGHRGWRAFPAEWNRPVPSRAPSPRPHDLIKSRLCILLTRSLCRIDLPARCPVLHWGGAGSDGCHCSSSFWGPAPKLPKTSPPPLPNNSSSSRPKFGPCWSNTVSNATRPTPPKGSKGDCGSTLGSVCGRGATMDRESTRPSPTRVCCCRRSAGRASKCPPRGNSPPPTCRP